jgi:hypothetical protein
MTIEQVRVLPRYEHDRVVGDLVAEHRKAMQDLAAEHRRAILDLRYANEQAIDQAKSESLSASSGSPPCYLSTQHSLHGPRSDSWPHSSHALSS